MVEPSNKHDSQDFDSLLDQLLHKIETLQVIAVDAGYKTPAISNRLQKEHIHAFMPYKRPMTPPGYFRKHDFVYDEYYDCFLCPNNAILSYRTTNREGYHEYAADPTVCRTCPFLSQCTKSQTHQKVVFCHIWQEALDEVEHARHTEQNKEIYAKRKKPIEQVFGDLKAKHRLR